MFGPIILAIANPCWTIHTVVLCASCESLVYISLVAVSNSGSPSVINKSFHFVHRFRAVINCFSSAILYLRSLSSVGVSLLVLLICSLWLKLWLFTVSTAYNTDSLLRLKGYNSRAVKKLVSAGTVLIVYAKQKGVSTFLGGPPFSKEGGYDVGSAFDPEGVERLILTLNLKSGAAFVYYYPYPGDETFAQWQLALLNPSFPFPGALSRGELFNYFVRSGCTLKVPL